MLTSDHGARSRIVRQGCGDQCDLQFVAMAACEGKEEGIILAPLSDRPNPLCCQVHPISLSHQGTRETFELFASEQTQTN